VAFIDELKKVVECKEENGKLFIKVNPSADKTVLMNAFVNLYKSALNGNLHFVRSAIEKANGQWECVGDAVVVYDNELDKLIELKTNPMAAYMKITLPAVEKGLTVNHLAHRLKNAGVIVGIQTETLKEIIAKKHWDEEIPVAFGISPIEGRDGSIEAKVHIEKSAQPKKREDGSVDYREILAFTTVCKGDIIAVRVPAEQGLPGKNIFGEEIPAKEKKEYELKPGKLVSVSKDGKSLVADETGVLINNNGIFSIKEYLELEDVDFDTGNVRFPGNIMINGNVMPGFVVESDGDIVVKGGIEAATIKTTGGSIEIKGGITGKNKTLVSAKNEVLVNFAQESTIECSGTVKVDSYIRHCKVVCREFKTINAKASVVGGRVEAVDDITLANSSNQDGILTQLVLFDPVMKELLSKRSGLETVKSQLEKVYTPLENDFKSKRDRVKAFAYAQGSPQFVAYEAARQKFEMVKKKFDLVEDNINRINKVLTQVSVSEKPGSISILNNGYIGTHLQIGNCELMLKNDVFKRKFFLKKGEIENSILI